MNKRISGVIRMHLQDRLSWIYLPWIIMGSSFVINVIVAGSVEDPIESGGLASIYIYMLVMGIVSVAQTFPFAIGFTVRRKDYLLGTLATFVGISALFAVLIVLLGKAESDWIGGWGAGLTFFSVGYLNEGNVPERLWVHFGFMLHMFLLGFLFGSMYRKLGKTGLFAFFIGLSLILTVVSFLISHNDRWDDIGRWMRDHPSTAAELSSYAFLFTALYAILSHLLLRKATA